MEGTEIIDLIELRIKEWELEALETLGWITLLRAEEAARLAGLENLEAVKPVGRFALIHGGKSLRYLSLDGAQLCFPFYILPEDV